MKFNGLTLKIIQMVDGSTLQAHPLISYVMSAISYLCFVLAFIENIEIYIKIGSFIIGTITGVFAILSYRSNIRRNNKEMELMNKKLK